MVFPVETEERVKRRAISVCQDHLRKVVEITRKVPQMFDCLLKEDKETAHKLFADVIGLEDLVDIEKRQVIQELAQIGAVLISREDFLRFTDITSEIADFCEGIAFRIVQIIDRKWKIPLEIKKDLMQLSEAVFETVFKLRETGITLSYGSAKALEKAREVSFAERVVDDLYRNLEMKIIDGPLDIPPLLLLRDITQLLEDSADRAEDASDAARILSLVL